MVIAVVVVVGAGVVVVVVVGRAGVVVVVVVGSEIINMKYNFDQNNYIGINIFEQCF